MVTKKQNKKSDEIQCPVCKGTGMISETKILTVLGGEALLERIKLTREEFLKRLNSDAPKLLTEIEKSQEKKFDEKLKAEKAEYETKIEEIKNQLELQKNEFNSNLDKKESKLDSQKEIFDLKLNSEREKYNSKLDKNQEELKKSAIEISEKDNTLEQLKEKIVELETKEKSVASRIGKQGELDFEDWINQFPQFECSEKLSDTGDYLVHLKSKQGNGDLKTIQIPIVVDHKKNKVVSKGDIDKILRDVKQRDAVVGYADEAVDNSLCPSPEHRL